MSTSTNGTREAVFDSISDSVRAVVDTSSESFNALKDRVADAGGATARALRHRIIDGKDVALDRGAALMSSTTRLAKAHPLAALGIALGALAGGYLAYRLLR